MVDELALLLGTYFIFYHMTDLSKQNHDLAIGLVPRDKFYMFGLKTKSFTLCGKPSGELYGKST